MADRVGQQLGNYRLTRLLGRGGFAEVYLGEHLRLKTQAAIKVLHAQLASDEVESFQQEAQTIANLAHPHIVRVLDFDVDAEGVPFLVMEYAPGGTLRQRLPKGQPMTPAEMLPHVKQVADALQYAHEEKLVHRDIKPENMLLGRRGEVLLSDFGIALVVQSSRYQSTQDVVGTLAYMAPEQIQGKPRPASDQYSLGIVIYEWLSGERPFRGSMTEVVAQHLSAAPAPLTEKLPALSPMLEQVVLTTLAKDPRERFGSMRAFLTAFETACATDASLPTQRVNTPPAFSQPLSTPVPTPPVSINDHPTFVRTPSNTPTPPSVNNQPTFVRTPSNTPAPAAPLPNTIRASRPPVEPLRTAAIPRPPIKAPAQPTRRISRRKVIVGGVAVVGLVAAGGITALVINSKGNTPGGTTSSSFHQEVTTGSQITKIQVGTGVDANSGILRNPGDTFQVGNTVWLVFTSNNENLPTDSAVNLFLNDRFEEIDVFASTQASGIYYASTLVSSPGIYKWEIDYNGSPEASITFQVTG